MVTMTNAAIGLPDRTKPAGLLQRAFMSLCLKGRRILGCMTCLVICPALLGQSDRIELPPFESCFSAGRKLAAEQRKPILLLFTVSDLCETCEALDKELFGSASFQKLASGFITIRLRYDGVDGDERGRRTLAAMASLRGFPTLYLLDWQGWPLFARHGYEPREAATLLKNLLAARELEAEFSKLRSEGRAGFRQLFERYQKSDLPLGTCLASMELWASASPVERIDLAPFLVGPAAAKDGLKAARPYLESVTPASKEDPQMVLATCLIRASDQLLRRAEFEDAARCLERARPLIADSKEHALTTEQSLAYAYRKLSRPCLARVHYQAARELSSSCVPSLLEKLDQQIASLPTCSTTPCSCRRAVWSD